MLMMKFGVWCCMGKSDVLELLQKLKDSGDRDFYKVTEIRDMLRRDGKSFHYVSVWRSVLSLLDDGMLEYMFLREKFQMNRVYRLKEAKNA